MVCYSMMDDPILKTLHLSMDTELSQPERSQAGRRWWRRRPYVGQCRGRGDAGPGTRRRLPVEQGSRERCGSPGVGTRYTTT